MIIGISGKIGSGKDTIAKIIQWLIYEDYFDNPSKAIPFKTKMTIPNVPNQFQNKKFAGKLKDIVCLLIGCTREQLEDSDFKNTKLGEEWQSMYYIQNSTSNVKISNLGTLEQTRKKLDKLNNPTYLNIKERKLTPRLLLQLLGTEGGRDVIHRNIWVNALFSDYFEGIKIQPSAPYKVKPDNWIVTDTRFPNEAEAVKKRGDLLIRVNRDQYEKTEDGQQTATLKRDQTTDDHPSETALDSYKFDYVINNNGTIEELIKQVKEILQKEKII